MKLTVKERVDIVYGGLIPEKGNIVEMELGNAIKKKVTFSDDEIKKYDVKVNEGGMLTIRRGMDSESKEIKVTPRELVLLDKQISALDQKEEISISMVSTCIKIKKLASEG
jgi:hypothetical protein